MPSQLNSQRRGGEFGINLDDTIDVVIVAGETTALLTVATGGDIDEVDGSLTARIISLAPLMSISGVEPTFDVNPATVMIQDDDELLVRITTLDNTISESDDISLLLTLSSTINRNLPVNLSYIDDSELLVNTGEPSVEEVPAGMTTYTFIVPIINDDIAAQSTRDIVISVATGAGYTPSVDPVTVNVVNDDSAVVSILAVSSTVNEGTSARFTVQVSNEIATSLTARIELTTVGEDFGINLDNVDVEIAAGKTNAMLTVGTTGDDIDEADSSLTATIRFACSVVAGIWCSTSDQC